MKIKNKNRGFTLVEIMITVTIIVILSSTVAISISSYVHERKGEEKVIAFYNELKLLKSFAMRDNARYLVKLNEGVNPAFEIYKDVDSLNGIPHNKYECEETEKVILFLDQESVAKSIKFGKADGMSDFSDGFRGVEISYSPANTINGEWNKHENIKIKPDIIGEKGTYTEATDVTYTDNVIIFENDEIGTINKGLIYLRNNLIKSIGYVIVRPDNENIIKLYKWSNGNWLELL